MTMLTPLRRASSRCRGAAGDERIERTSLGVGRPAPGQIVRDDDDRRDAVAGADGPLRTVIGVGRRQRLDPGLTDRSAADDPVEQIEGLGQHVIVRRGLERRHVDAVEERAQPQGFRRRGAFGARGQARRACRTGPFLRSSCRRQDAPAPAVKAAAAARRSANRSGDRRRVRRAPDRRRSVRRDQPTCGPTTRASARRGRAARSRRPSRRLSRHRRAGRRAPTPCRGR